MHVDRDRTSLDCCVMVASESIYKGERDEHHSLGEFDEPEAGRVA
jgi:hypothetical protein